MHFAAAGRDELLAYLFSLTSRGIKYDLDRIRTVAQALGNPQQFCPCVHVAGTNGKGSTATMIASVLRQSGYRTGLYTSPHLVDFEERFLIDGLAVQTDSWLAVYRDCAELCEKHQLTFFEIATVLAFELFRRAGVQVAVYETGLGGRLDATNCITPQVSVITSVSMDHSEYLGTTLEQIAFEKLGIVKPGVPAVVYASPYPFFEPLVRKVCSERQAPLTMVKETDVTDVTQKDGTWSFTLDSQRYTLGLRGEFQVANAICAIRACQAFKITDPRVLARGIELAHLPGRMQKVTHEAKTLYFDVGHNPAGAQVAAQAISSLSMPKDVCIVAGIMADKDFSGILAALAPVCSQLILCSPALARAAAADLLESAVPQGAHCLVQKASSVADAVSMAVQSSCDTVLVTGSFHTVGEAMSALKISPYKKMQSDLKG